MSKTAALSCGLTQGYVFGHIFFILSMFPLSDVISKFKDISYLCYADDIHMSFSYQLDLLSFILK